MDRIISTEQYRSLVSDAKQKKWRLTNVYFFPKEIDRIICNNLLYYEILNSGGYLICVDKSSFLRCYFYLPDNVAQKQIVLTKPAVIEIPFTNQPNDIQQSQINKVQSMGFRLGRQSGMMSLKREENTQFTAWECFTEQCGFATSEDSQQILELLNQTFDPLYSFLPNETELKELIKQKYVFVIKHNEELLGALLSSYDNCVARINQVVVKPEHRGKGLGRLLLNCYHRHYDDVAKTYQHWVDLNNLSAISMYKECGYEFTVRKCNEYILETGDKK